MRRDHFRFSLNDRDGTTSDPWWAEFATLDHERGGQAISSSPAFVICKAALEAVDDNP